MEKQKVYSEKVRGRSRTYFLDVRKAENGTNYLVMTESKKDKEKEGEFQTSSIMVFEDDVDAFHAAIGRVVGQFHVRRRSDSGES